MKNKTRIIFITLTLAVVAAGIFFGTRPTSQTAARRQAATLTGRVLRGTDRETAKKSAIFTLLIYADGRKLDIEEKNAGGQVQKYYRGADGLLIRDIAQEAASFRAARTLEQHAEEVQTSRQRGMAEQAMFGLPAFYSSSVDQGGTTSEWFSPDLGTSFVFEYATAKGFYSRVVDTVTLGEPDWGPRQLADSWKIDYGIAEKRLAELEAQGQPGTAEQRRLIEAAKAKQ